MQELNNENLSINSYFYKPIFSHKTANIHIFCRCLTLILIKCTC